MLIRTATADDAGRLLEIYSYYVPNRNAEKRPTEEPKNAQQKCRKTPNKTCEKCLTNLI